MSQSLQSQSEAILKNLTPSQTRARRSMSPSTILSSKVNPQNLRRMSRKFKTTWAMQDPPANLFQSKPLPPLRISKTLEMCKWPLNLKKMLEMIHQRFQRTSFQRKWKEIPSSRLTWILGMMLRIRRSLTLKGAEITHYGPLMNKLMRILIHRKFLAMSHSWKTCSHLNLSNHMRISLRLTTRWGDTSLCLTISWRSTTAQSEPRPHLKQPDSSMRITKVLSKRNRRL